MRKSDVEVNAWTPNGTFVLDELRELNRSIDIDCTPHRLRHTSATMMLNHNVAITTVGAVLGHTDIRMTGV